MSIIISNSRIIYNFATEASNMPFICVMNIPEQVKNEARVLIEQYGDTFEYLGIYEGQEAYVFKFPGDSCTGYPFVYLYDGKDATEITGPLSLDVIDSCIENIEEGDIE